MSLMITVSIASCAASSRTPIHPNHSPQHQLSTAQTNCRLIQHEMGKTEVCGQPQRIVVLGPYILELLLALDAQPIGFADHVAFHQGNYTHPSQQIPYLGSQMTASPANVGTAFSPSLEVILKVKPDLILGLDANNSSQYKTLSKIAPTLLLDYTNTEESLRAIAEAIDRPKQVEPLLAKTQQKISTLRKAFSSLVTTHPKVLLIASSQLQEMQLERGGACSSAIEALGFQWASLHSIENADSDSPVPISLETLAQPNDADLIILLGSNFSRLNGADSFEAHQLSDLKQEWKTHPITQSFTDSKAGRVYFIPVYLCRGLPGPIGTELYLNELKQQLLTP